MPPEDRALSEHDAVLAANRAFYRAFARGDAAAMERLWASRGAIACVHPGWPALVERERVLASWRDILANPSNPQVRCRNEQVLFLGELALVLCEELIEGGVLAASNLFLKEDGAWRLVHHQAGPTARPRERAAGSNKPPRVLH